MLIDRTFLKLDSSSLEHFARFPFALRLQEMWVFEHVLFLILEVAGHTYKVRAYYPHQWRPKEASGVRVDRGQFPSLYL